MSLLQDVLKLNSEARGGQYTSNQDTIDSDDDSNWINVVSIFHARDWICPLKFW